MVIINIIPFLATGRLNSNLLNYSIAISMFLSIIVDIKWIARKSLTQVGLSSRLKDIAYFACGAILALLVCGGFIGIVSILRADNLYPAALKAIINPNRSLLAFVVIPLVEELFHRGYFMGNTFGRLSYWQRSVLSAFLFSLSHWSNSGYSSIFMFIFAMAITTFLFGLFFNNVRMLTGSIWMGFAFHWFINFIYSCIFLETENYDIAVILIFIFLVGAVVLTSRWVQKKMNV